MVITENAINAVIPAEAGIQSFHTLKKPLDPGFQRGDDLLRDHQWYRNKEIGLSTKSFLVA